MGENRLLAIDIQSAAGGPLDSASVYPPLRTPQGGKMQPLAARQVARDKDMDAQHHDARPSEEALKLRRMRVRNEISLITEGGTDRGEDLEALREDLRRLSKQIEEAGH